MKRRTDIMVENMFTKNQLRYGSESWKYKNHIIFTTTKTTAAYMEAGTRSRRTYEGVEIWKYKREKILAHPTPPEKQVFKRNYTELSRTIKSFLF